MRESRSLGRRIGSALVVFLLLLWGTAQDAAAKDAAKHETPEQTAAQLSKVTGELDALAVQFDADKDESLSSQEQDALVKFVTGKYGPQWAERAKAFLRGADRNGDGVVDRAEWTAAIEKLKHARSSSPP